MTMTDPATKQMSDRGAGVVAVLTATLFWSTGGVLGKATGVGGVVLGFWRMWIATLIMTVVIVVMKRIPTWADIRRCAPTGILFGFNICAFFITLQYVSIAVALIIGALTPVAALPLAAIFFHERLTPVKIGCAVAAVAGVVVAVIAAPPTEDHRSTVIGYLWAVASLLIWVAYLFVNKRARREVETIRLMWVMSFIGALTVSVIAVVVGSDLGEMQGTDWVWVILLCIGPGIAGHGLFAWAQTRLDASVSSVLIQGEPVGASVIAWIFLGESMSAAQMAAMAVVLAALCVLAYHESREGALPLEEGRT